MKTFVLLILFAGLCVLANAEYLAEDEQHGEVCIARKYFCLSYSIETYTDDFFCMTQGERNCKPNLKLIKFCRELKVMFYMVNALA